MNTLRALYHLAWADFLERVRRYSFFAMLGMVVWLGYVTATGSLEMKIPPNYVGEINSPWVGALMSVTAGIFLVLFGFYSIKGSVSRDYESGVGQIIATTPLSRPLYVLGKWLSNFAVLSVMILILILAGIGMVLLVGKAPLELWGLVSPLLMLALPGMAIVAALAVLFETIGWLRGGFGNIVYFFVFLTLIIPPIAVQAYPALLEFTGIHLVSDSILQAARLADPGIESGFVFQIMETASGSQRFHYDGMDWTAIVILSRFFVVLAGFGLAMLASAFFDRFNLSRAAPGSRKQGKPAEHQSAPQADLTEAVSLPQVHLTPLHSARRFRFDALYVAELKMLLKGRRWWWYVVSLGLVFAQITVLPGSRPAVLAASWLWMILLLSELGNREVQYNTREIVFSAPRPILNQLPAAWLAAVTVLAFMGLGALLGYLVDGETSRLLAWFGGVLFIPSLALVIGALTLSRKPFEVVYVVWMYIILNDALSVGNELPPLDFVGVVPNNPWHIYALLAIGLLALAAFIRRWQMTSGKMSAG